MAINLVTFAKAQVAKDGKLQETDEIVGINVTFHHENDRDSFAKLLDLKKYSHSDICTSYLQDKKEFDLLFEHADNKKDRVVLKKIMPNPNKYRVSMDIKQANKFIKDTLQIKIDSIEQLGTRLVKS